MEQKNNTEKNEMKRIYLFIINTSQVSYLSPENFCIMYIASSNPIFVSLFISQFEGSSLPISVSGIVPDIILRINITLDRLMGISFGNTVGMSLISVLRLISVSCNL
jgi:hypothetical protein